MRWFGELFSDLFDLLAPAECVGCLEPHPPEPETGGAVGLCSLCRDTLVVASDPPPGIWVPYEHGGALASAIHRAKYGSEPAFARTLGRLLSVALPSDRRAFDAVVPVPLHRRRLSQRGFNQAAEMARALGPRVAHGLVRRTRDTPAQVGLGRHDRLLNVAGAFAVSEPGRVRGARLLVVDDVVTTGATLRELTKVLAEAGAVRVQAVALSRAALAGGRG